MVREPDFVDECYADKDLSLLKKLTLVIPTYNRNFYLSRCLWYHAHFPFGQIIVADSSPEEKKVVNRETVAKIRSVFDANILYLEYDDQDEEYGGNIYRKWTHAAQHIVTEYAQNCTDKELVIPSTSYKAISFLEENAEYSVAEGMDYQLSYNEDGEQAFYEWQGNSSYTDPLALNRVMASLHTTANVGMQFSIQRTENFKNIYQNLEVYNLYDIRFGEAAIELSPLMMGKTKKLTNVAGNIRDTRSLISSDTTIRKYNKAESSCSRYPLIPDYPRDRYMELFENLVSYFSRYDTVEKKDLQIIIDSFIHKRYQHKQGLLNKSKPIRKFVETIWFMQPKSIQDKLRIILGEKMLAQPNPEIKYVSDDMDCILEYILSTDAFHEGDHPLLIP